jgi:general secretion pathway protein K
MRSWPPDPEKAGEGGFALLIVLWTLVLIALVVSHLAASARTEARIAANLRSNAMAEAEADGAVYEAVFHLIDQSDRHWEADGAEHHIDHSGQSVSIRIVPLDGRINPNLATTIWISALLRETGTEPSRADAVAQAIVDWRTPADDQHPIEARSVAYRAAGMAQGPPGEPFETLDELGQVLGVTKATLAAIKPHMTVFTKSALDVHRADPVVARVHQRLVAEGLEQPDTEANPAPPASETVAIEVQAAAEGARFTRYAVVLVEPGLAEGYSVLYWDRHSPE